MTPHSGLMDAVRSSLERLRSRVLSAVPSASAGIDTLPHRGVHQLSITFLDAPDAETLDLCVLMLWDGGGLSIAADLTEGGTGRVVSELKIGTADSEMLAAEAIESFVNTQDAAIIQGLRVRRA